MKSLDSIELPKSAVNRRNFMKTVGGATAAFAAMGAILPGRLHAETTTTPPPASPDSPIEIFTAALIAEDLASVFYYNALVGPVIQDPSLAGTGGTAMKIASNGNGPNVGYLRCALNEEIVHAQLFRSLLKRSNFSYYNDPYQTFYFPDHTFEDLKSFTALLSALENAFIGAYLAAVQEFSLLAAQGVAMHYPSPTYGGVTYQPADFAYFAKVSASILGVESEHRVLGNVINNQSFPNQLNYEATDGITSVYNGSSSAAAALTPFLTGGSGYTAYKLSDMWNNARSVSHATQGDIPA